MRKEFEEEYKKTLKLCNDHQRTALLNMKEGYDNKDSKNLFLLMAPAGTGKTFIQNGLIKDPCTARNGQGGRHLGGQGHGLELPFTI